MWGVYLTPGPSPPRRGETAFLKIAFQWEKRYDIGRRKAVPEDIQVLLRKLKKGLVEIYGDQLKAVYCMVPMRVGKRIPLRMWM